MWDFGFAIDFVIDFAIDFVIDSGLTFVTVVVRVETVAVSVFDVTQTRCGFYHLLRHQFQIVTHDEHPLKSRCRPTNTCFGCPLL